MLHKLTNKIVIDHAALSSSQEEALQKNVTLITQADQIGQQLARLIPLR